MIFAISTEIIATPPKPRTPAINATIRKARAQPNMREVLRIDSMSALVCKKLSNEFCSGFPITLSRDPRQSEGRGYKAKHYRQGTRMHNHGR
jgi:hypothetical protein